MMRGGGEGMRVGGGGSGVGGRVLGEGTSVKVGMSGACLDVRPELASMHACASLSVELDL